MEKEPVKTCPMIQSILNKTIMFNALDWFNTGMSNSPSPEGQMRGTGPVCRLDWVYWPGLCIRSSILTRWARLHGPAGSIWTWILGCRVRLHTAGFRCTGSGMWLDLAHGVGLVCSHFSAWLHLGTWGWAGVWDHIRRPTLRTNLAQDPTSWLTSCTNFMQCLVCGLSSCHLSDPQSWKAHHWHKLFKLQWAKSIKEI